MLIRSCISATGVREMTFIDGLIDGLYVNASLFTMKSWLKSQAAWQQRDFPV